MIIYDAKNVRLWLIALHCCWCRAIVVLYLFTLLVHIMRWKRRHATHDVYAVRLYEDIFAQIVGRATNSDDDFIFK